MSTAKRRKENYTDLGQALFSPLRMREVALANRIVLPPMAQGLAREGAATDWHFVHYGKFAASGVGLTIVEATCVEPVGRFGSGTLLLCEDEHEAALARIVRYYKTRGQAAIGIQLAHAGRKGSRERDWSKAGSSGPLTEGWPVVGPSAVAYAEGWQRPTAATSSDLERMLAAFVDATRRADRAGFDLIEVHAAHGYLLHQFLSPVSNRRADQYGGDRDGRMRYPMEVVAAMRRAWPAHKAMGVRISATDGLDDEVSWSLDDTVAFAQRLEAIGIDYVCLSSGGSSPRQNIEATCGYQVPYARRMKDTTTLVVMAVGLVFQPADAAAIVARNDADLIALGRGLLYDPHWSLHAAYELGAKVPYSQPYRRADPALWLDKAQKS